ncbi:Nucleoporin Nup37 [Nymphon striatum]|nr:Nucleoporin Nup37 [Nymphon striatum]
MATPRRQRITAIEAQRLIIDGLEDDSDLDDDSSESSAQECDVSYQNHADESSDDNFDDMPDGDVPTADISQPLSHSVSPDISPRTNDCWQDVGMDEVCNVISVPASDRIERVEFSPFEWSSSLFVVAVTKKITIGTLKYSNPESPADEEVQFEVLKEIHHAIRSHALDWSPQSSLLTVPKLIRFASADADRKIRIYTSNLLRDTDEVHEIEGHTDYINAIAFEPDHGRQIVSVSDDHTCRVWGTLDGSSSACFPLTSAGVGVKWHVNDPAKLMVAEKKGLIRFYNILTLQPIMSLSCEVSPLMDVDWSPSNSLLVGCISNTMCVSWDISRSSLPLEYKQVHQNSGYAFRFCPSNHKVYATLGDHDKDVKVFHTKRKQAIFSKLSQPRIADFSWHCKYSLLAVALDRKIEFFKIEV